MLIKRGMRGKGLELERKNRKGLKGEIKRERLIEKDRGEGVEEQAGWCE